MYMWTSGSFPSIVSVATCTRCCVDAALTLLWRSWCVRVEFPWAPGGRVRQQQMHGCLLLLCGGMWAPTEVRGQHRCTVGVFFFLPSWNSSLNMMHMKSIIVETRSSRETIRDVQVVWKTLISLVAGSRLGFVTLTPSWLAVDRSLSCLRLCDPPSAFCSQNSF